MKLKSNTKENKKQKAKKNFQEFRQRFDQPIFTYSLPVPTFKTCFTNIYPGY